MTVTETSGIGRSAEANGICTNYLEAGSGDETVLLIHGSGFGILPDADLTVHASRGHSSVIQRTADFDRQVRDFLVTS